MALLALTLVALGLRAWGLGASSVTHDEAYGLWVATRPLVDVLPAAVHDVHPPLYYLLLHGWLALGPHNDTWARLPSALVGTALVPAVYALGRRLWNVRAGLVAALLTALSPLAVAQAREARMYPLAALLLSLAAYALLRATEEDRPRWWAAYVLLCTLALYTHYYAIFAFLVFTFYALRIPLHARLPALVGRPGSDGQAPRSTLRALLPPAACLLLYLPWLPALADQFSRVRAGFWIPPPSPEALGNVAQTLAFFAVTPRPPTATPEDFAVKVIGAFCVMAALLVPVIAGTLRALANRRLRPAACDLPPASHVRRTHVQCTWLGWPGCLLPILWLLVPVALAYAVSLLGLSVFEPRYFAVCLPAFLLLVALGVTTTYHRRARGGRRDSGVSHSPSARSALSVVRVCLLAGLVVASLASLYTFVTFPAYRPPDTRDAAAWLRAQTTPADAIVHTSQFSLRPIVWYNGDDAAGVLTDDPVLPARLASAPRIFLVVSYDVRVAAGPRDADAVAAEWVAQHGLWDLQTVARFWGVHIYEWTNQRIDE